MSKEYSPQCVNAYFALTRPHDGRYESKELGAVYEIIPGTNAVTMRIEGASGRSMTR